MMMHHARYAMNSGNAVTRLVDFLAERESATTAELVTLGGLNIVCTCPATVVSAARKCGFEIACAQLSSKNGKPVYRYWFTERDKTFLRCLRNLQTAGAVTLTDNDRKVLGPLIDRLIKEDMA